MNKNISEFIEFLDNSPSCYHATANLEKIIQAAGYTRLHEHEDWTLLPGEKYYMIRGGTTLIAFRIPRHKPLGFLMSASHVDRPTFKVKGETDGKGGYTRLYTESYGGMIMSTWLDRPLSVAGRVMVDTGEGVVCRLVNIDRDLLLIPNVAIHMNRQVNDGYKFNPAVDTLPLIGGKDAVGKFYDLLEQEAGGKIMGRDLFLYNRQKASVWGVENEYISSGALDDLACAWSCTQAFLKAAENDDMVPVLCCFDDEEVGSNSPQGAASTLLADTLNRICNMLELNPYRMLAQSFMVSADNAHAVHPNHPEYSDAFNAPIMGNGVVLKFNANQRYTTDAVSAAVFRKICANADVNVQEYSNRADIVGGSTLGHISLTHVSVPTADVGLPQLAMHSSYETIAAADLAALETAMIEYYSSVLEVSKDGGCAIHK